MTIPEILLILAEIAAAQSFVYSDEHRRRRFDAIVAWQRAVNQGRGLSDSAEYKRVDEVHKWRKAEIAKAVAKVRASFGVQPSRAIP